ncbi:hypothetical protein MKX03_015414 [Papaver bracteatum]|nr:hypothetical protein MKX03_015414 [Papaver bracteatum]
MATLSTYLASSRTRDSQHCRYKIYSIKPSNFFNKHPHLRPRSFQITLFHLPNAIKDERFVGFTTRANLEFPVGNTVDDKIGETHKRLLSDLRKRVMGAVHSYGRILELEGHLKKLRSEAEIGHSGSRFPVELIRTAALESTNTYFRYIGSLTTPPCTENVTWTILEEVREMSKEQVASLRAVMSKENQLNARPIQPLNGRIVELHVET